jgi:hypothetical protein
MASQSSHKSNYALAISYIVQELLQSYDAGETLNLTQLKGRAAKQFRLSGIPKMSDLLQALPISHRAKLWPFLKTKPVRTASGVAVVAVMSKPHRCPHIEYTGNVCVYCPGGPDSDFEYSTQAYTGYEPTSMRAIRARYDPYSQTVTDLDLQFNRIGNEGASLLARVLESNALPNLTSLSLSYCTIGEDGLIALVSALEQNSSLLHLDLRYANICNEQAFLTLAESLPGIKVLQQLDVDWSPGLASAMPLLLVGLRKNTSLFHFHVGGCAPTSVPPTKEETARCAGGWMREMERLGYRNRCLALMRTLEETHQPRGIWPHALARVATLPDVIFEVLCSTPAKLVPSEVMGSGETVEDTDVPTKRKRGEE